MPKYLTLFKYTPDGYKGFLKEGAASREEALRKGYASIGGKVDAVYWTTSGDYTGAIISDIPETAPTIAFLALVGASGALAEARVIDLTTSADVDLALAKTTSYRPPGG